ncbi:MAG: hypothetical protein ACI90V_014384 [Bacillariaceae sp.]|jgi:hypothetical protein
MIWFILVCVCILCLIIFDYPLIFGFLRPFLCVDHTQLHRYNWLWVLFCTIIFAGAMCDTYINRDQIEFSMEGKGIDVPWILVMSITWGLVLISFVSVILNHFLRKSCELRMFGRKEGSFVLLGWRQAEGLVALFITSK